VRSSGCRKNLIEPHPATAVRADFEPQQVTSVVATTLPTVTDSPIRVHLTRRSDQGLLLPPVDLQLVLQHFVI
jgi:hypothetical protein